MNSFKLCKCEVQRGRQTTISAYICQVEAKLHYVSLAEAWSSWKGFENLSKGHNSGMSFLNETDSRVWVMDFTWKFLIRVRWIALD